MQVQREPLLLCGFEQRPIEPLTEGDAVRGGENPHRNHPRVVTKPLHLGRCLLRILQRHADRREQPFVRRQPVGDLGVVHGPRHGRRVVRVGDAGRGA